MNRVDVPKVGRYSFELDEEEVRGARCFALDLHWFFSMDALAGITRDLKVLNPSAPIVVGGITASFYATYLMEHYPIDFLVQGDAEYVFPRLIECIFEGRPVPALPNLHRRAHGPPATWHKVEPERYNETDYLTRHWFPSLAAHTREGHRRFAEKPFWDMDDYHPFLTLNRGCRFSCNFCFGAYQVDVFGPGQVDREVEALERSLDAIVEDPELHFVNLMFGTESSQHLDLYRPVLEKHRPLGVTMLFCELPRFDQVELLLGAFDRILLDFTNPAEIPFPLRAAGWTIEEANDHLLELGRFLDGRANCQPNISFMSRKPSEFRDRLKAERFETLQVKDNYEWNLPKPNKRTLPRGYRPDKTEQAEEFRAISRGFGNFIVARALAPGLYPILDHPRADSHCSDPAIDVRHDELRRFYRSYGDSYAARCVATIDEVRVGLRLVRTERPPQQAGFGWRVIDAREGEDLGAMRIERRFNGIHVTFRGEVPDTVAADGGRIVLGPTLQHDPAHELDLFRIPGLPLWTLDVPPTPDASSRLLELRVRVSQDDCTVEARLGGRRLVHDSWSFLETRPESDLFGFDPEDRHRETPEMVVHSVAPRTPLDERYAMAVQELLARVEERAHLKPWSVRFLDSATSWACWELTHPSAGRVWLFALPRGLERCFVRGRFVDLVYRAMDGVPEEHPEIRRLLKWIHRIGERL
ncbi:MAG: hypothetical protein ACQEXJ_10530 [Myxococcota bacterium]